MSTTPPQAARAARRLVVVTGTSTEVGKTVATATLAAAAVARGERVVVVKPVQTGIATGDPGDAPVVAGLVGCEVREFTRLEEPLAPDSAARRAGVEIPPVSSYVAPIVALLDSFDTVVVEGAGGLLVRLDTDGGTLLDLAVGLRDALAGGPAGGPDAVPVEVVVVCAPALGTLNHAELTVGALRARGLEPAGVLLGSWPEEPGLAETVNRTELPRVTGLPLLGVVPAGVGALDPASFRAAAPGWLTA